MLQICTSRQAAPNMKRLPHCVFSRQLLLRAVSRALAAALLQLYSCVEAILLSSVLVVHLLCVSVCLFHLLFVLSVRRTSAWNPKQSCPRGGWPCVTELVGTRAIHWPREAYQQDSQTTNLVPGSYWQHHRRPLRICILATTIVTSTATTATTASPSTTRSEPQPALSCESRLGSLGFSRFVRVTLGFGKGTRPSRSRLPKRQDTRKMISNTCRFCNEQGSRAQGLGHKVSCKCCRLGVSSPARCRPCSCARLQTC